LLMRRSLPWGGRTGINARWGWLSPCSAWSPGSVPGSLHLSVHRTHAQERQKPVRPGARRKGYCTPWTLPGPGQSRATRHGRRPVWGPRRRGRRARSCWRTAAAASWSASTTACGSSEHTRVRARGTTAWRWCAPPRGFAGTLAVCVLVRVPACGAARSRQACRPEGRRPRCAGDDVVWGLAKRVLLAQVARVADLSLEGGAGGTRHASCVHAVSVTAVLLHGEIRRRNLSFEDIMKSLWFMYKLGKGDSCNGQPPRSTQEAAAEEAAEAAAEAESEAAAAAAAAVAAEASRRRQACPQRE